MTQRELARHLGVTVRSVQNYESGAVTPYKHLRRIELLTRRRSGWILAADETDNALAASVAELHKALELHQALLSSHLSELQRQTQIMREQREARERRSRSAN